MVPRATFWWQRSANASADREKEAPATRIRQLHVCYPGERARKNGELRSHNINDIRQALHPNAPSFPGTPGLWMCICSDCADTMEDVRLIVRVQTTPALWQYMGQYDLRPSDPLSTQEWAMQSDQVCSLPPVVTRSDRRAPSQTKQEWVKCIHDENWGTLARARIKHRQLKGREPTGQEIENFLKDKDYGVTPMDIREAFDKGEEVGARASSSI